MKKKMLSIFGAALLSAVAFAETRPLESGQTAVTLSSGFLDAMNSLGVTVTPVLPGQSFAQGVSFPVSGGTLDLATARGEISHGGGLEFTAGSTKVQMLNFVIDTTETPKLTGAVISNGTLIGRGTLFDLTLPALNVPLMAMNDVLIMVPETKLMLSAAAAEGLNTLFGVTAFTPGFEIGTAKVSLFLGRRVF